MVDANGTAKPKAIPGAEVEYVATVTNQGPGTMVNNTFSLIDEIAANGCLRVSDLCAPASGHLMFAGAIPGPDLH